MDRADTAAMIRVSVAWSPKPGEAFEVSLEVACGTNALEAIRASGVLERHAQIDISTQEVGIWGRAVALDSLLADGDRVEIYRPLLLNPKEARRLRAMRK
jgi:uncharacterized protein